MRILLVEDDVNLSNSLVEGLKTYQHFVEVANSGEDALDIVKYEEFDAIILDLSLPEMSGLDVLNKLRSEGNRIPVLILTASHQMPSRLSALDKGADDYLTKPFDLRELEARIRVIYRRSYFQAQSKFEYANLSYDSSNGKVLINNEEIKIPKKELVLLDCLLHRQGLLVTKKTIMDRLYTLDEDVDQKVIDLYVHRLRKRIEKAEGIEIINMKGLGFFLQVGNKNNE